jgi:triacylglycerol esterase/lipase EstA (alpha/beta hydrolase family)
MATLGLYRPAEFLERAPMMFYALEEDVGYKVPVVFVHGIDGNPRDFAPLLERLDRTRYKAWFFYYPTGQDLSHVAAMFHRVFLSGKVIPLSEMPLVIVAHSMGGVVVREAMNRCTGRAEEAHVARLITIASPLGGHPAAHLAGKAPLAVPSWRDLDPEGTFIANLHRRALPAGTEYHLFYTKGETSPASGEPRDDGVVPIASQLVPAARREAAEQIGFAASHTGVLRDAAAVARIVDLIGSVKSPFPEDHMRELLRGGYALPAGNDCTPLEAYLIRTIGHYMDALVAGRLQPLDPSQAHFVEYCRGKGAVKFPTESAWTKLCRALPDRDKN